MSSRIPPDTTDALIKLCGRISNAYARQRLSPPYALRDAARSWLGLDPDTVVDTVEAHLDERSDLYYSGSGDGLGWRVLQSDLRKLMNAPSTAPSGEPQPEERPRRRADKLRHRPQRQSADPSSLNYHTGSAMKQFDAFVDDDGLEDE